MAILIISTGGLIYDGITNVIVSYLEAMDLTKLDIYVAGSCRPCSRFCGRNTA